jgi:cytochrome d ubiquinol oxidase subunit II
MGSEAFERAFRTRALVSGLVAGALAVVALFVVRSDAPALFTGLTSGGGLVMVVVSAAAGLATLLLVWRDHLGAARVSAAVAVAAIVAGWAFAQAPQFLPGLTVRQAAAGRSTLLAVIIAVAAGAIVLVPSLILLFRLFLRGRFDPAAETDGPVENLRAGAPVASTTVLAVSAGVALVAGATLTVFADGGWLRALGIICLFACATATFVLATTEPDGQV